MSEGDGDNEHIQHTQKTKCKPEKKLTEIRK